MDKNKNVNDLTFDLQKKLDDLWKQEHKNGKLPDVIGYLLSEIRREWFKRI